MSQSANGPTVTLNPAFLQEIKESNVKLWNDFDALRQLCDTPLMPLTAIRQLVPVLLQVRDGLSLQFALEDSCGYFLGPADVVHRLASRAAAARAAHGSLYLLLSELCEQAEDLQYRGPTEPDLAVLLAGAQEFALRLLEHEQEEAALIALAYDDQLR